jgi:heme A synthase
VLGVVAGASRAAPVVVLNLVGGFAMLALCAALATPATHAEDSRTRATARTLLAIVFARAAAGAWASATASADCGFVAGCGALPLAHRTAGVVIASQGIQGQAAEAHVDALSSNVRLGADSASEFSSQRREFISLRPHADLP